MNDYSSGTNSYLTDVDTCSINRHSHSITRYYPIGVIASITCNQSGSNYTADYDRFNNDLCRYKTNATIIGKSNDVTRYYQIAKRYINNNACSIYNKVTNNRYYECSLSVSYIDNIRNNITKYYQINESSNKNIVTYNRVSIV